MPSQPPLIDRRTYAELVAEVEELAELYTAGDGEGWRRPGPGERPDAGWALIRLFGRMAELVVARLNRIPERSFLAFLDLIGTRLEPPQPARVPLTFQLAAGSPTDALVPAGTQVAATPLEGEAEPPIFETQRDLVVSRSRLVAVYTREPERDGYEDRTAIATGLASGTFHPFRCGVPLSLGHTLFVAHSKLLALPEVKEVRLRLTPASSLLPWPRAVVWEMGDGASWQRLEARLEEVDGGWLVRLERVPAVPVSTVAGRTSAWLRGRLATPLPGGSVVVRPEARQVERRNLAPDAAFATAPGEDDRIELRPGRPFHPFGEKAPLSELYLAADEVFSKPGAAVEIGIDVDAARPPGPSEDLLLVWEFWDGAAWRTLEVRFTPAVPEGVPGEVGPFLSSGVVGLSVPGDWKRSTVPGGAEAFWLRVRRARGSFSREGFRPPVVERLTLGYTWPLPWIKALRIGMAISQPVTLTPDLGFSNQLPVDLKKDFLPFGERPRVGDALYLASDAAFSRPGATVALHVVPTNPADPNGTPPPAEPSSTLRLEWQSWNGHDWQTFGKSGLGVPSADGSVPGFADRTNALKDEGNVTFPCPAVVPVEVGGETRHWIRVRIASGNYGEEARYEEATLDTGASPSNLRVSGGASVPIFLFRPPKLRPPSLRSIRLGYDYTSPDQEPEHLLVENDFTVREESAGFHPFVPVRDVRPALHLGFERPGDAIGFANRTAALYFGVAEELYDASAGERRGAEGAVVVWKYWNGVDWQRLGTQDETRGFTRRGMVTFIGPPDLRASTQLGVRAFWLQACWQRGEYAVRPRLWRVLPNTVWALHAQTVAGEVLGSGRGEPGQTFRIQRTPVLPGQRLEVGEPELPSAEERKALEAEEGKDAVTTVLDAAGQVAEVRVRWHEVPDFHASGPRSRHYTLDSRSGEVRFGDGRHGMVPPPGRNNVRMARYQVGGGLAGNRPAGNVVQLKGTVPYVDGVTNHEPAEGGAAEESLESARIRGPRTLRHGDRATAVADVEDLALQASSQVARVQGIAARDRASAGGVGLIVVPRSAEARPVPSLELLERVRAYVEARLSPVAELWVAGPDWLEVTVEAEIVPRELEAATDVQNAVLARLAAFLHPLTGGLDGGGWAFGRKPYRSDLYALLESVPGVDHVRWLDIREAPGEGGARPGRFLIFSGRHRITLTGSTDDAATDGGSAP